MQRARAVLLSGENVKFIYVNYMQIKVASLPHQQRKHNHGLAGGHVRTDPGSVSVAAVRLMFNVVFNAL
jgi:hypothetical protein